MLDAESPSCKELAEPVGSFFLLSTDSDRPDRHHAQLDAARVPNFLVVISPVGELARERLRTKKDTKTLEEMKSITYQQVDKVQELQVN